MKLQATEQLPRRLIWVLASLPVHPVYIPVRQLKIESGYPSIAGLRDELNECAKRHGFTVLYRNDGCLMKDDGIESQRYDGRRVTPGTSKRIGGVSVALASGYSPKIVRELAGCLWQQIVGEEE